MFSPLSMTVADDGSKHRYYNNENWSDKKKREFQGKQNFNNKKRHYNCEKHDLIQNIRSPFWCNSAHIITIMCSFVYILFCLHCNFFTCFVCVSMFTYYFVYIVMSLHCFFHVSKFTYYFVYIIISYIVFSVFLCSHVILFTL